MIRSTLLWLLITWLALTAWKDWYRSLCGLVLLMGFFQHPDMPKAVFDLPGVNPWNLLFVITILAYLSTRRLDGCKWDMPSNFNVLLFLYLCVIVLSFFRMIYELDGIREYSSVAGWPITSTTGFWNDYFFNTIKWAVPGILFFDGCRTESRLRLALAAILGAYLLIALQVIKSVPIHFLTGNSDLSEKTVNLLRKDVGYHRTDLAVMLAGSFWALFSARAIFQFRGWSALINLGYLAGLSLFLLSLALTGGRGGYLAWAVTGLILSVFRYRKLIFVIPIIITLALPFAPALVKRASEGINVGEGVEQNTLTAGRNIAWPLVIEKIVDAPILGYGREAMKQTGIASKILLEFGDSAPHPHNAYLEMLLDNGIIGLIVVLWFYSLIMKNSLTLLRAPADSIDYRVVGGVCLSLVGCQLVGSFTGQTFYPREATVGMWCSIGLLLRMVVTRFDRGKNTTTQVGGALPRSGHTMSMKPK